MCEFELRGRHSECGVEKKRGKWSLRSKRGAATISLRRFISRHALVSGLRRHLLLLDFGDAGAAVGPDQIVSIALRVGLANLTAPAGSEPTIASANGVTMAIVAYIVHVVVLGHNLGLVVLTKQA